MTTTATQAAAKTFVAFFTTKEDKGPVVELFKVISDKERAPMFSGKIDGKQVSLFVRHGANGTFLGLVGDKIEGTNNSEDLGTANIRTRANGSPVLVIDLKGAGEQKTTIFASISKQVSNETLVELGLNLEKQAEKAAAHAAAKAAVPAAAEEPGA